MGSLSAFGTIPFTSDGGVVEIPRATETTEWFVLHTKSRQECALARDLRARDIRFFLPMIQAVRYYGRWKKVGSTPLFPGYVFLHGTLNEAYEADRTSRVARIIEVADQGGLEMDLTNLGQAIIKGAPLSRCPYLNVGVHVEITAGPFKGIRGLVERISKSTRLILNVENLGQASCLEIEGALVRPVESSQSVA